MRFFKKAFGLATDEFKKSIEESKKEMLKGLSDSQKEILGSLGIMSSNFKDNDEDVRVFKDNDEDVRVKIGTLTDGVLEIEEGFKTLKKDSLEDYKGLRKIVFPSSLNQLEECAIYKQALLEELDFSKVTLLTEIPDSFISGNTKIKTFIVPEGVKSIGEDFMDNAHSLKELYIPSTVTSVGSIGSTYKNSVDVYLYARGLDLEDMENQVKTFYVLAQNYDEYVEQLQEYGSNARIRIMPEEKFSFYDSTPTEEPIKSEPTTESNAICKADTNTELQNTGKESKGGKNIWWVNDLSVLYNGEKYALKYTDVHKGKTTGYIYDDVYILNKYQLRIAQKQADGSILYGVACTCGWNFLIVNCEYPVIDFMDGDGAVLAVDEDGDEYAIDRWGRICSLEKYTDKVKKSLMEK